MICFHYNKLILKCKSDYLKIFIKKLAANASDFHPLLSPLHTFVRLSNILLSPISNTKLLINEQSIP